MNFRKRAGFLKLRVMADDAKPIEINVGGRIFATTVGTLRFERESMLARLFDPDRGVAPLRTDSAGRPFLDREHRAAGSWG